MFDIVECNLNNILFYFMKDLIFKLIFLWKNL